jgi:hypothetical protein
MNMNHISSPHPHPPLAPAPSMRELLVGFQDHNFEWAFSEP